MFASTYLRGTFLHLHTTFYGMASKGLRTAFVSTVTEVEAGDKVSHTTETLICYTVCVCPA